MKKWRIGMLLTSVAVMLLCSCEKDKTEPVTIRLSVTGGVEVVMQGTDLTKEFVVTASEAVAEDVTIELSTDAREGKAVLEKESLILPKGETSVKGNIVFKAEKFPSGAVEETVRVSIACEAPNMEVETGSTDFKVSGFGSIAIPRLEAKADPLQLNVTDEAQTGEIVFTLSETLDQDLAIVVAVGPKTTYQSDGAGGYAGLTLDASPVVIAAGEKTASWSVKAERDAVGKIQLRFSIDHKNVSLLQKEVSFEFVLDDPSVKVPALCPFPAQPSGYGFMETFTVGEYTLPVRGETEGSLNLMGSLTVPIGEGSPVSVRGVCEQPDDPYVAVAWIDWNRDGKLSQDELVMRNECAGAELGGSGTVAVPAGTKTGYYGMRIGTHFLKTGFGEEQKDGCYEFESADFVDLVVSYEEGMVDPGEGTVVSLTANDGIEVAVDGADVKKTLTVSLSEAVPAGKEVIVRLLANSNTALNGELSTPRLIFAPGEKEKEVTIWFKAGHFVSTATVADVIVTISSSDAQVDPEAAKVTYHVSGTAEPVIEKQDIGAYYQEQNNKTDFYLRPEETITVSITVRAYTAFPTKPVTFEPVLSGLDPADYDVLTKKVVMDQYGTAWFEISVGHSAAGKTLTVRFESEEATFSDYYDRDLKINFHDASAPAEPQDLQIDYTVNGKKDLMVSIGAYGISDYYEVVLRTKDGAVPETPVFFDLEIEGLEREDYYIADLPKSMDSPELSFLISFYEYAKGKTGKLIIRSDYSTFAEKEGITLRFE